MTCKHSSCKSFFRGSFEELWNQSQFLDLLETVICLTSKLWQCLGKRRRKLLLCCCPSHRTRPSPQAVPASWHLLTLSFLLCKWKETRILSIRLPTCCLGFLTFQIRTSEISEIQIRNNTTHPTFASVKVSSCVTEAVLSLKKAENTFEDSISYVK